MYKSELPGWATSAEAVQERYDKGLLNDIFYKRYTDHFKENPAIPDVMSDADLDAIGERVAYLAQHDPHSQELETLAGELEREASRKDAYNARLKAESINQKAAEKVSSTSAYNPLFEGYTADELGDKLVEYLKEPSKNESAINLVNKELAARG